MSTATTAVQRILTRISNADLQRRWTAVRRAMSERQIGALVMQAANDWLGGYVKWFTDVPAGNGYPRTVVFYADEPMTVVEMGPMGAQRTLTKDSVHRGVGEVLHTPSYGSINYTHEYDADLVSPHLNDAAIAQLALSVQASSPMPWSLG
jgi:hypothetical protein